MPFGEMLLDQKAGGYDSRYKYTGKETDENTGLNYHGARYYNPSISMWYGVDPLAGEQPNKTPYHYTSNNPINRIDPDGRRDDWVEFGGEMFYDNRVTNQVDATALYGEGATYRPNGYTYTASNGANIELGDYGFFKENGTIKSSSDRAQYSTAYTNPSQAMADAQSSISNVNAAFAGTIAIRSGQATDAAIPDPTDAAWPKWVGHAVLFLGTAYYMSKMQDEIDGITRRAGGPQGAQYSLQATGSGSYPCYTCGSGSMNLSVGDVWKYGQTTNVSGRYSDSWLRSSGLRQVNEFFGNQVQIKVMEKTKIYGYFLQNGHLPPGNKIFR